MQDKKFEVFDDNDFINANLLKSLGIDKKTSRLIIYLANKNIQTNAKTIEIATGLRQPEVSIAIKKLRKLSWINENTLKNKKGKKGRPYKLYNLNISIKDILLYYTNKKYEEYMNAIKIIESLKRNLIRS